MKLSATNIDVWSQCRRRQFHVLTPPLLLLFILVMHSIIINRRDCSSTAVGKIQSQNTHEYCFKKIIIKIIVIIERQKALLRQTVK